MIKPLKSILLICLLALALTACDLHGQDGLQAKNREELNPPANAYTEAIPCTQQDTACQTLRDFYQRKPGFKETLHRALDDAGVSRPLWLENPLTTAITRTNLNNEPLLIGHACEPRNCAQVIYIGYVDHAQRVFGFYRTNERLQWFGSPDEAEKSLICAEDQLCTLESKVSEIPPLLMKIGFPSITQPAEFTDCTEYKGGITTKNGFACREQFVTHCPFSSAGCTVSGEFVSDQLAALSFKYKSRLVKSEELKKVLDKAYGKAETQLSQPDPSSKVSSWVSEWQDGRVAITLRRIKGINGLGERYDDVWISFADKAFALFNR